MKKQNIGVQAYPFPMPLTILGTHLNGKPNYMTLGWVSRVNYKPPLIGIGVNKANITHEAILESKEFSINFPSSDMMAVADYVGLISGKRVDKSTIFACEYGTLKAAPLITDCPLSIECKLYQAIELPTNYFFIGEIVGTWCEERFMTGSSPDIEKMKPFVLTMPDNRYWQIGACIGSAWKEGKALKHAQPAASAAKQD